jgi:hypothetical protein
MPRASEIFGRILNLPIVAFQTGLIEFLSKAGLAKAEACSFRFAGGRGYGRPHFDIAHIARTVGMLYSTTR